MSFVSAVDRLHALGQELAPSSTAARRKFDLEHMRILARALGNPQTRFPSVLIAGTNGKGSTSATLSSILAAAGFRTGLYTSPHLTRVTERIRVAPGFGAVRSTFSADRSEADFAPPSTTNNEQQTTYNAFLEIPEPDFARLYFQTDEAANRLVSSGDLPHHPSFFETLTALAFLYFAEQRVDIAILEVGLGGRLDATNIVHPILSVITDIALDHQEYLGNTIAEIAREKAGILRANGTLVTLPQHPEANQAIGEVAVALNVRGISAVDYIPGRILRSPSSVLLSELAGAPFMAQSHRDMSGDASTVSLSDGAALPPDTTPLLPLNHYTLQLDNQPFHVRSPLAGEHQQRNIALAIAAAVELRNYFSNKSASAAESSNQYSYELPQTGVPSAPPGPRTPNLEAGPSKLEPQTSNLEPSLAAIELGIAQTSWPGRLEFLPPNLLLDVAHNPAGAWTLRAAIASLPEDTPRTLIFSCLRDKDLREMAQILFPLFDSSTAVRSPLTVDRCPTASPSTNNQHPTTNNLILTPIQNPRAASLESLMATARSLDIPAHAAENPAEALALARSLTPPNGLILATGSIYLIGALRDLILP